MFKECKINYILAIIILCLNRSLSQTTETTEVSLTDSDLNVTKSEHDYILSCSYFDFTYFESKIKIN